MVYDPNYVNPYIQNFNMSVTRKVHAETLTVDVRWVATRGTKLTGNLALNQVNYLTNGLLEALEITRAGGNATLFDQMFRGLNISGSGGFGPVGDTVGGVLQTGSMQLRQNNTFRGNIANGNFSAVAASEHLNTSTAVTGSRAADLLRNSGLFPENFIVNNPQFSNVHVQHESGQLDLSLAADLGNGSPDIRASAIRERMPGAKASPAALTGFLNVTGPCARIEAIQGSSRTHEFRINGTFELPFGPNKLVLGNSSGVLARAIERWQLSAILNLASGAPLSITGTNTYIGGWTS